MTMINVTRNIVMVMNATISNNNTSVSSAGPHPQATASSSDARTSAIVKCSFMIVLFAINFIGNILTVEAIRKTERLQTNTNMMVAALAVNDLLVGLVVVAYVIWNLILFVFGGNPCSFRLVMILAIPIQQWVIIASNVQIVALALDR